MANYWQDLIKQQQQIGINGKPILGSNVAVTAPTVTAPTVSGPAFVPTGGYPSGPQDRYVASLQNMAANSGGAAPGTGSAPGFDPSSFMSQVLSEAEAQKQAQAIFAPQLEYLAALESQTKANAASSQAQLGDMYGKVAEQIFGQAGAIGSNYDKGTSGVNDAYNAALNSVLGRYSQTDSEMNSMLERLGIMAAQPNTTSKSRQQRDFLGGIMNANQQATTNALAQQKQGALTFNTAQGNIARQEGANQQAAVGRKLADFLTQLTSKKADIQSSIMDSASKLRGESFKTASDNAKFAWQQATDERDFNYRMAKDIADRELRNTAKDPLGEISNMAINLYGGNRQAAQNAIQAIQDAMNSTGGQLPNAEALQKKVIERLTKANGHVSDATQLRQLIDAMFSKKIYGEYRLPSY